MLAAARLRNRNDMLFLLVGDGASRPRLRQSTRRAGLGNVQFLACQPKERLAESLSAAGPHLVPLDRRVASSLMPSRLYGILAVEKPLVAVAPEGCELTDITRREGIGWVVTPGDSESLAGAIAHSVDHRERLVCMGRMARKLAETCYGCRLFTRRFQQMLLRLLMSGTQETAGLGA